MATIETLHVPNSNLMPVPIEKKKCLFLYQQCNSCFYFCALYLVLFFGFVYLSSSVGANFKYIFDMYHIYFIVFCTS